MTPFGLPLQFLTVLPINLKTMPSAKQNGQAILFYPFVGLLIGLILFALISSFSQTANFIGASIILVLWI